MQGCALQQNKPVAPTGPRDVLGYGYGGITEVALAVEDLRAMCEVTRATAPESKCLVDDEKAAKVRASLEQAIEQPERAQEILAAFNGAQIGDTGVSPQVARVQGVVAVLTLILEARQ
jgi:hypothetical protein